MDSPNQPQSNPSMSKPLAWVILVVIIITLGVGGYLLLKQGNTTNNGDRIEGNANTNSNVNTNTAGKNLINTSQISARGDKNVFSNDNSSIQFEYPKDWVLTSGTITENGHIITFSVGSEQGDNPKPYDNNASIKISLLNKDKVQNYDWPLGVGGTVTEGGIEVNGHNADERLSENTNELAFPNNTIPQLSDAVLLVTDNHVLISSLYTGGENRNSVLTKFRETISSLKF